MTWWWIGAEAFVLADTNSCIFGSVTGISNTDTGIRTSLFQLLSVKTTHKNLQLNYSTTIKADITESKDPCVDICANEHTFFALITDQFGNLTVSYWHNTDIAVIRQYRCFKISYQDVGQALNIKYLVQMLKAGGEKLWKTLLNSYMILLLNGGIIKWRESTPSERFCCQGETSIKYLFFKAHAGPVHHPG